MAASVNLDTGCPPDQPQKKKHLMNRMAPHLQQVARGRYCVEEGVRQRSGGAEARGRVVREQAQDESRQLDIHLARAGHADMSAGPAVRLQGC